MAITKVKLFQNVLSVSPGVSLGLDFPLEKEMNTFLSAHANVKLIDINETPIERITLHGIKTSDLERGFDVIIYATGFDSITGAFDRIDIRGVEGVKL